MSGLGRASVVIPCYRYGHYLPAAVRAALDQPGLEVEVIVVDDASPDDSGEVAEALAAADPRVRVIRHRTNRGHLTTYDDGLAAATGDWVALVSADDLLTPGAVTRAAQLMTEHPSVGLVYGRARHFDGDPPEPVLDTAGWTVWPGREWIEARCRQGHNVIASPEVVLRGSLARRLGGYRRDLPHAGDLEMWLRAAAAADVGYVVGPDQALYRQHATNMHRTRFRADLPDGALIDLEQRWAAFRIALGEAGPRIEPREPLERLVRQTLADEALDRAAGARGRGVDPDTVQALTDFAAGLAPEHPTRVRHRLALDPRLPRACARAAWLPFGARNRWRSAVRRRRLDAVGT